MTAHEIPAEAISRRPSTRKQWANWERVDLVPNGFMLVCPVRRIHYRELFKVLVDGDEFYASPAELDLLWMGKTPEELDLEPVDPEPEDRDEWAGSRLDLEASAADERYQMEQDASPC